MNAESPQRRARSIAVHLCRWGMFVIVLALIHIKYRHYSQSLPGDTHVNVDIAAISHLYPAATALSEATNTDGSRAVLNADGATLGHVMQTSPQADQIVGFSGPTNTLIALDANEHILGFVILASRDTRDHVRQVERSDQFFAPLIGKSRSDAVAMTKVDAVSGATLTSLAILEGISLRLGGEQESLRFPEPVTVAEAASLFPQAVEVQQSADIPSLWQVFDGDAAPLGSLLRTSPAADNVVGYQGPTETLIGFDPAGRVVGIRLRKSYDNEPYVGYVAEDEYGFLVLFDDMTLEQLAELDIEQAQIEGVSGATMTSMAIVRGLVAAADARRQALPAQQPNTWPTLAWTWRDLGTGLVILLGLLIGFSKLRGNKWLRRVLQLLLIGYLGLINGDMLSQAMLVGWAQSGVPWRNAGGLLLLTVAALFIPLATRRNIYCSHLCPHGAAQQILKQRLPWQIKLTPKVTLLLRAIPFVLLGWCVVVAMLLLPFSLVDIEPFDAWVFYVAGIATIAVAVVGLVASLFVPMAYCRYGCPTGALLGYLRYHARSGEWNRRDWAALGLVLLAVGLAFA